MNHLKEHVLFYLGLVQLIMGWAATVDPKTLTFAAAALSLSGLLTLVVKYVKASLPDPTPEPEPVFTQPAQPAQLVKEKQA